MRIPESKSDRKFRLMESGMWYVCHGGSKKDSPDPPDYEAAAERTAEGNLELLNAQTLANRPNQYTPFGSSEWQKNGDQWTQNINLDPQSERALASQLRLMGDRSELGSSMMGRVENEFGAPMDWSQFGDYASGPNAGDVRDRAEDAMYTRATSRLDPQWEQRTEDTHARLVARGLRPGDPAYQREMENLERAKTDAYDRALTSSIVGGGQEAQRQFGMDLQGSGYQNTVRQAQIAEEMQKRGFSLNEINAIISGQQVGMPNMPSFSMAGRGEGPDYLGAANAQYQGALDKYSLDQQAIQGLMQGVGSMAFGFGAL